MAWRTIGPFDTRHLRWSGTRDVRDDVGGKTAEISGMDLVLLRGERLSRNEVYFDRMALVGEGST